MNPQRVGKLADSIEQARDVALTRLNEPNIAGEAPIEVFLVETDVAAGDAPSLESLTGDFYDLLELPAYFTAASFTDFLKQRHGIDALRSIWRGEFAGADRVHLLGGEMARLWAEWRRQLANTPPATLDTARLRKDGC